MTKAELIATLSNIPDDSEVFIGQRDTFFLLASVELYGDNIVLAAGEVIGC